MRLYYMYIYNEMKRNKKNQLQTKKRFHRNCECSKRYRYNNVTRGGEAKELASVDDRSDSITNILDKIMAKVAKSLFSQNLK